MQEANKAARDVVWLLTNFISLFRNYTEINYTMQNITYLKNRFYFSHNVIKSFNHILKKILKIIILE